jgi:hypothetical protein
MNEQQQIEDLREWLEIANSTIQELVKMCSMMSGRSAQMMVSSADLVSQQITNKLNQQN